MMRSLFRLERASAMASARRSGAAVGAAAGRDDGHCPRRRGRLLAGLYGPARRLTRSMRLRS